jgi:hypothetical protein
MFTDSIIRAIVTLVTFMMEAVNISETSVKLYQTTHRNISEDSRLHIHRCESLKALLFFALCAMLYTAAADVGL